MDGVQLFQGCNHFEETVYVLPLIAQKILVLIWPTSEGWMAGSTMEPPSDFEPGTRDWDFQCPNHWEWCPNP